MEGHLAFDGDSKALGQKRDSDFIEQIGRKYINTPYLWGGKSPLGIDCSGFTQLVFRIAGYSIPRDSSQQASTGKPIENFEMAKPGDLIIFTNESNNIDHVGILLEENKIIHASGKVRIDKLVQEGIIPHEKKIISHYLHSIRRVIP
jgi:cell wall-associated NlpC family hydrolase